MPIRRRSPSPASLRSAALALLLLISGCVGTPAAGRGGPTTLAPGERIVLADHASLRYLAVVADSRCRPDVQCIHAGDADIAFVFQTGTGGRQRVTLNTISAPDAPIGAWRLHLVSLAWGAAPAVTVRVDRS